MNPTDAEVLHRYPDVPITPDTLNLYRGFLDRVLLLNRCATCRRWHHPPRGVCPHCWSEDVHPAAVDGRGRVALSSVLHRGAPAAGVDYRRGYLVAAVDLVEQHGLRFTAALVGTEAMSVTIGMPVCLGWVERDGAPVPAFRSEGAPQ